MKTLLYLLAIICLFSCNSKVQTIKGDLYFKLVDISPSSGMSKEEVEKLKLNLKNYNLQDSLSSDKQIVEYLDLLEKNNLLGSPFIYLKSDGKVNKIFISKKEYEKVKSFSRLELDKIGKKVEIELEYELKDSIYYSDKILKITENPGQTLWSK